MADTIHLGSPTSRGIASTSAVGSPSAQKNLNPTGVASTSALGSPSAQRNLNPSSVASTSAFGSPQVNMTLGPVTGIASTTSVVDELWWVGGPIGGVYTIGKNTAFGSPKILRFIDPTSIDPTSGLGSPSAQRNIRIGSPWYGLYGSPTGSPLGRESIASTTVFGSPRIQRNLNVTGIASTTVFGSPSVYNIKGPPKYYRSWINNEDVTDRTLIVSFSTIRLADGDIKVYYLSNRPYRPQDGEYIPDNVLLGTYIVNHSWGNKAKATTITIHNPDGKYDGLIDGTELLIDRSITILAGDADWPLMSNDGYDDKFVSVFTGRITGGSFRSIDALSITAQSLKHVFETTTVGIYLNSEGTGRHQRFHYIVGESQLFAPIILGRCFNVPVIFARNWHAASKITVDDTSDFDIGNWVYATKDNVSNGSPVAWGTIVRRQYGSGNSNIFVANTRTSIPGQLSPYYGFTRSDGVTQTIFESSTDPGPIGSPTYTGATSVGSPVIYDYPEFLVGLGDLEIANVRWKGAPLVENADYAVYTDEISVSQNTNTYTITATFISLFSVPSEINSLGLDTNATVANLTVDINGYRTIANLTNNRYFRLNTISANSVDRTYDQCYRGKIYDPTQDDVTKTNLSRYLYWANFDNVLIDTTSTYSDFSGSP